MNRAGVLLTAGGTGGNLFPTQAPAAASHAPEVAMQLTIDARAAEHAAAFQPVAR